MFEFNYNRKRIFTMNDLMSSTGLTKTNLHSNKLRLLGIYTHTTSFTI